MAEVRTKQRLLAEVDLMFEKAMIGTGQWNWPSVMRRRCTSQEHTLLSQYTRCIVGLHAPNPQQTRSRLQQAGSHATGVVHNMNLHCASSGKCMVRHVCGKMGHIKKVCCSKPMTAQSPSQNKPVHRAEQDVPDYPSEYTL